MRVRSFLALVAFGAGSFGGVQPAVAAPAGPQVQALAREIVYTWARTHPLYATELGITDEDDQLENPSRVAIARDERQLHRWDARLRAIDLHGASLVERDDAALVRAMLLGFERRNEVYRDYEKDYSAPAQAIIDVTFTQFQHLPVPGIGTATEADRTAAWNNLIGRLEKAPTYIANGEKLAVHPGHLQGVVGAEELAGAPDFLNGALSDAAKAQLPPDRFAAFVAARDPVVKSIRAAKAFIDAHAARWPENYAIGKRAYEAMLRDEELLPFDAGTIVRMGYDELAHGWADQLWLEHEAQVRGTALGAASGGGMAPSGEALIPYYRERIRELKQFVTTHDIVTVPAWLGDVSVVETPSFLQPVSPGASMESPRLFSKETNGFYFITPATSLDDAAKRLDLYQDFDRDRIWSTAAHEVMPGHFLQLSIAHRNPDFVRRIGDSASFAEGWAFYGEELFVKVGLYGDDLDGRMDVAQWERIRGVRAILDPKLATGEWTVRQADDFFAEQTGATPQEARAAVNSIALGPGYVISYTVGRFQLETLLADYRRRLGDRASLHDFHDRLLSYGTTPFSIVGPELLSDLGKSVEEVRAAANF